ncbi:zinc finger protein 385B-like isoform X2 [Euwallacea fornicatus]|uniref:zinc finger protein 385B-like isoform X2 n=1 Tax=Euwallacea fornicatus TaxID=995702 RepID=UPI00338D505F
MASTLFQSIQKDSECNICNAKLPGPSQAESHYTSARHMNNLLLYKKKIAQLASNSQHPKTLNSRTTMNTFDIPTVFQKPINVSNQYLNKFYCNLCNLKIPTMMEEAKHVKEFPHCSLVAMKTNLLNKGIDKEFYSLNSNKKSIHCILCNIDMSSDQDCNLHFNGNKHLKNFNIWCSDQQIQNFPKPAVNLLDSKNNNLNSHSIGANEHKNGAGQQRSKSVSSNLSSEIVNCHICKMSIVKSAKNEHMNNFPHIDLAAVKTQLLKMGINKTFCSYSKERKTIKCTLCDVIMQDSQTVKSHFGGKGHVMKFNSWCAQQPVENLQHANNWFHCNICTYDLDGTSDAVRHYEGKSHLKVAKTLTQTKPNFDHLKLEGFVANLAQGNGVQNKLNVEETAKVTLPKLSLKTQIFNELEKLIQTLYFSKKVPYEVSLQHLKKINRDIEDIVKKHHQKKNIRSNCDISCEKSVYSEVKNRTIENEFFLTELKERSLEIANNSEEILLDEKQPETVINNTKTISEMPRIVTSEKFHDKSLPSGVNDSTVQDFFLIDSQNQSSETANNSEDTPLDGEQAKTVIDDLETVPELLRVIKREGSCDKSIPLDVIDSTVKDKFLLLELKKQSFETANNSKETSLDEKQSETKTIPEILRIVEIAKSQIKQDTSNLEVEILTEIEELLKQIDDPKAPFREILKYLKTFNEVLEGFSVLEKEIN